MMHLEIGVHFDYAAFLHLVPLANVVKRSSAKRKDPVQIWEGTPFLKQDDYMVLINSWYFDFEKMVATRDPNWAHYDPQAMNTRIININFNRVYRYIAGNCILGFFTEPEEHFDQKIIEAYLDFVAEKTLLE